MKSAIPMTLLAVAVCFGQSAPGSIGPATAVAQEKGADADKAKKREAKKAPYKVDAADVIYGRPKRFDKPAEVSLDSVFAEIPAYKKIVDDGLAEDDVKYVLLMKKATVKLRCAVRKAAKDLGYDLVAKLGTVEGGDDPVPDITQEIIDRL